MYLSWQAQDAANLMVSDFAKASHNLQFLDLPDVSFVAGTGRGQPYGLDFAKASHNLQCLDLSGAFFRGRRKTRPTLWFQILRKLRTFCNFWTCQVHFSWQAQDAANLMIIFRGRRCTRAQIVRLETLFFTRFQPLIIFYAFPALRFAFFLVFFRRATTSES